MDWQHIVEPLGIKLPTSPDFAAVIIAVVLIVGAAAIGWYFASRSGPPLARQLHRLMQLRRVGDARGERGGIVKRGIRQRHVASRRRCRRGCVCKEGEMIQAVRVAAGQRVAQRRCVCR